MLAALGGALLVVMVEAAIFLAAASSSAMVEEDRFPVVLASICSGQPLRDTTGAYRPLVIRSRQEYLRFLHDCNEAQAAFEVKHPDVIRGVRLRCGFETPPVIDDELSGFTHEQLEVMLERTVVRYLCLQLSTPERVGDGLVAYRNYYSGLATEPPMVTMLAGTLPRADREIVTASTPQPAPTLEAVTPPEPQVAPVVVEPQPEVTPIWTPLPAETPVSRPDKPAIVAAEQPAPPTTPAETPAFTPVSRAPGFVDRDRHSKPPPPEETATPPPDAAGPPPGDTATPPPPGDPGDVGLLADNPAPTEPTGKRWDWGLILLVIVLVAGVLVLFGPAFMVWTDAWMEKKFGPPVSKPHRP